MLNQLSNLETEAVAAISSVTSEEKIRELEILYLGRKGRLTEILRRLKDVTPEERGKIGTAANTLKNKLEQLLAEKFKALSSSHFSKLAETEWLDPTAPGMETPRGTLHPLTQFIREAEKVFTALGFTIASGPEIEDDFHNFTALNIPADHPARDAQDTLFLQHSAYSPLRPRSEASTQHTVSGASDSSLSSDPSSEALRGMEARRAKEAEPRTSERMNQRLLRTQTSSVQIRFAETHKPPFRIVAPGRVFRKDDFDASHSPMFHQLEGLVVDKNISLAHMKAVLEEAIRALVNPAAKFRFRSGYFPFVEPGLEVDMSCTVCGGKGCAACKYAGWTEICGAGLVHPRVLENVKIDPKKWTGFAFGFGIDRMVMQRHRIHDIRLLYENDLRFLRQF